MPIQLSAPQQIVAPATQVKHVSVCFTDTDVRISLQWLDANDNVVSASTLLLTGADYTTFMNDLIVVGQVGLKFKALLKRQINAKIKAMLNIDGTVVD